MNFKRFGTALVVLGIVLSVIESSYFGNWVWPRTDMEMIADLICLSIQSFGIACLFGCEK